MIEPDFSWLVTASAEKMNGQICRASGKWKSGLIQKCPVVAEIFAGNK